jgi:hypothetical protein
MFNSWGIMTDPHIDTCYHISDLTQRMLQCRYISVHPEVTVNVVELLITICESLTVWLQGLQFCFSCLLFSVSEMDVRKG